MGRAKHGQKIIILRSLPLAPQPQLVVLFIAFVLTSVSDEYRDLSLMMMMMMMMVGNSSNDNQQFCLLFRCSLGWYRCCCYFRRCPRKLAVEGGDRKIERNELEWVDINMRTAECEPQSTTPTYCNLRRESLLQKYISRERLESGKSSGYCMG
jgi:hypothetical protein